MCRASAAETGHAYRMLVQVINTVFFQNAAIVMALPPFPRISITCMCMRSRIWRHISVKITPTALVHYEVGLLYYEVGLVHYEVGPVSYEVGPGPKEPLDRPHNKLHRPHNELDGLIMN